MTPPDQETLEQGQSPQQDLAPTNWDFIRDDCGWMFGGIISMIAMIWMVGGGAGSFGPPALGLGLSIMPPVVDVIRRFAPYWRWTFVPTGAFLLGFVALISAIVVHTWGRL